MPRTVIGFVAGIATTLLVVGVAYQAGKRHTDSSRPENRTGRSTEAATSPISGTPFPIPPAAGSAHSAGGPLPAAALRERAALEEQLADQPDDLVARKRLAVLLVTHEQFMDAFEHAEEILGRAPDDPDGLYVESVVRLRMGQLGRAGELIDRVLDRYPQHEAAQEIRRAIDARTQNPHRGLPGFTDSQVTQ